MDAWLIWLIIAVVLLVFEMLTITAAVGMLGVAALITAGFAALGLPVPCPAPCVHSHRHDRGAAHPPSSIGTCSGPSSSRFGVEALIGKPAYVVCGGVPAGRQGSHRRCPR